MLNPDKPKNVSIEDYEALTVDAKESFTFEQERQMKGGNSDLAGTPDGLAGPTTALFTLAYYVTIDDAVVLLDSNSSPDEKAVAGLFLFPTPGKFAKPFLKHADDVGGGLEKQGTKGSTFNAKVFEKEISNLSVHEKIAKIKSTARDIAKQNSWTKNNKLSKRNKRDVYYDSETGNYYALDTQHGRFEVVNKKGKHLGEVDFSLNATKPADKSGKHDLNVR